MGGSANREPGKDVIAHSSAQRPNDDRIGVDGRERGVHGVEGSDYLLSGNVGGEGELGVCLFLGVEM